MCLTDITIHCLLQLISIIVLSIIMSFIFHLLPAYTGELCWSRESIAPFVKPSSRERQSTFQIIQFIW